MSALRVVVSLGFRGLAASRGTTVMLVLAVAIGTGFQIPNTANLDGLHHALLEDGLARGAGDLRVEPLTRSRFSDGDAVVERLRGMATDGKLPVRAIVPTLVFPGAAGSDRGGKFFGAPIIGIDADQPTPFHVIQGADFNGGDPVAGGALVGATIAQRLHLRIGDTIHLRILYGGSSLGDNLGKISTHVRGIVTSSSGAYRFVFVDRAQLADDAGTPGAVSTIAIHLEQHEAARALVPVVSAAVPEARVVAWRDDETGFASYLDARDVIGGVSYAMVIAAIAIPMWALLYIQVLRRRRELAILRSLGFTRSDVFATCLLQALALAILGGALGTGLGYAAIQYFEGSPLFEWESLRVRPLASASTFITPLAVIVVTAVVAAIHPAWRASRVEPAGVLRRIE